MDSLIHLDVFLCLPLADGVATPTGKARFDAHKAQYDALNKIYGTYFSPGKAPSRACMAVEWIPGDSLIEIVGSALVVNSTRTIRRKIVQGITQRTGEDTRYEFEVWLESPLVSERTRRDHRGPGRSSWS